MTNTTFIPVKIEITYSNSDTQKQGVKIGDQFEAEQECLNGVPKMQCYFHLPDEDYPSVAYACEHDVDADILVTTCKIIN